MKTAGDCTDRHIDCTDRHIEIPKDAAYILDTLMNAGFEAFVVGGCVRDSLIGRVPKDWDITTSAKPAQVKALFSRTIDTGIAHGTVTVMMHREGYEVTTYRIDGEYEDSRHPREVTFTDNLIEDLKRRDFTINAMAYNPRIGVVDAFDGIGDIERHLVRCVGNPADRFGEDALRIMRAVRFAAQLDFDIDPRTAEAVKVIAPNLKNISAERVQMELVKLLVSPNPQRIRTACDLGITDIVLPEYNRIRGLMTFSPNHVYDVETHTLIAMQHIDPEPVLRLAMLIHDFGKAEVEPVMKNGSLKFTGHSEAGAQIADKILRRLKMDNSTRERVVRLIRWHSLKFDADEVSMRRMLHMVGEDIFEDLIKVQKADLCAKKPEIIPGKMADLQMKENIYQKVISENQCFKVRDLAIGGRDLIRAGMKPGPQMGEILEKLCTMVIEDQSLNTTDSLMAIARDLEEHA